MRRKDREVTAREETADILNACRTACIAMIDQDQPYVVPLSYGYEFRQDTLVLYFHCAKEGRKLDILKRNNTICFSIFSEGEPIHTDTPCNSGYYYSSIIGNGTVEFIEDPDEKKHALRKLVLHQTGKSAEFTDEQTDSVCVFQIVSADYTGKRKPKA